MPPFPGEGPAYTRSVARNRDKRSESRARPRLVRARHQPRAPPRISNRPSRMRMLSPEYGSIGNASSATFWVEDVWKGDPGGVATVWTPTIEDESIGFEARVGQRMRAAPRSAHTRPSTTAYRLFTNVCGTRTACKCGPRLPNVGDSSRRYARVSKVRSVHPVALAPTPRSARPTWPQRGRADPERPRTHPSCRSR